MANERIFPPHFNGNIEEQLVKCYAKDICESKAPWLALREEYHAEVKDNSIVITTTIAPALCATLEEAIAWNRGASEFSILCADDLRDKYFDCMGGREHCRHLNREDGGAIVCTLTGGYANNKYCWRKNE